MENNKLQTLETSTKTTTALKSSAFTTSVPSNSSNDSTCSSNISNTGASSSSRKRKYSDETQQQEKDGNCSYTSMIAQAIMKTPFKRATLSEIYNYMSNAFEILKKRGNGWRNCVRHTLSLNECFVKLNRPENGRSCNWTVHPSYFEAFLRGDYRKRRSNRKKLRETHQWVPNNRSVNYPPAQTSLLYMHTEQLNKLRQNELERMRQQQQQQQQSSVTHPSMWHSYVSALESCLPPKTTIPHEMYAYHNMYSNSAGNNDKNSPVNTPVQCTPNHNIHTPAFPVPGYAMSSPSSSDYGEHHSAGNIDSHTGGRGCYSRSCETTPTFPCKSSGGERLPYEALNRPSPYGSADQIPSAHFQIDSACYGNFSTRSYRPEYF